MKKYILIVLVALGSVACNNKVEPTKDARVVRERDSLMRIITDNDKSMNDVISSFNEVEKNLATVREKQGIIKVNVDKGKDVNMNRKERINQEIQAINDLMT